MGGPDAGTYMLSSCVRPSVRLPVCHKLAYCIKTTGRLKLSFSMVVSFHSCLTRSHYVTKKFGYL